MHLYIIIATPTDFDALTHQFDTASIERVARQALSLNPAAILVIKSTVPIGYTEGLMASLGHEKLLVSPEFLREGRALYDNLYPSRIVIGGDRETGNVFATLLQQSAIKKKIPVLLTSSMEAEAIKLFSNTYLAMRVSFFNELDSFGAKNYLNVRNIIEGVCHDPRIGMYYNNPSFGYGGYCLPKDTRQLLANYDDVPQELIKAVIDSNTTRKSFIADQIINRKPKVVGIYRLVMKHGSDNFRSSSIVNILELIRRAGIKILLYEPEITDDKFHDCKVVDNLRLFKKKSDIILTNRWSDELNDVSEKIYTRDVFGAD